jgi:hypothetical protein
MIKNYYETFQDIVILISSKKSAMNYPLGKLLKEARLVVKYLHVEIDDIRLIYNIMPYRSTSIAEECYASEYVKAYAKYDKKELALGNSDEESLEALQSFRKYLESNGFKKTKKF